MAEEQPPAAEEPTPGEASDAVDDNAPAGSVGPEEAAQKKRPLTRSSTDKVIAGVAGGIGAYFGIDAVIVRIAFIVLTFLGGAGPFLYLIGWLGLPREDSPSVVANALRGDSPHRFRSLTAVVLIVFGLLITANLSGELFDVFIDVWSVAPYLALILIAAGVALVLWPGSARRPKPTPARPRAPTAPAPAAPPTSSAYATSAPPPPTAAGPEWSAASAAGPFPMRAAPPANGRRGRSLFGTLTVAALLVYAGGVVMLARLDAVEVDVAGFLAVALAITGVGLLVSAFIAPARGLIFLGVALAVPLLLFAGADVRWGSGMGEVQVSVADAEGLQDDYSHGLGEMVVDLRWLELDGSEHSVDISLGIGEVRVYVPDNISTTADVSVGIGSIRESYSPAAGRTWISPDDISEFYSGPWETGDNGIGLARRITTPLRGDPTGELRLDINVGIGEARVVTVPVQETTSP